MNQNLISRSKVQSPFKLNIYDLSLSVNVVDDVVSGVQVKLQVGCVIFPILI